MDGPHYTSVGFCPILFFFKKIPHFLSIYLASLNGHKDIADLLIEKHADIYLATNDNETALDIGIYYFFFL